MQKNPNSLLNRTAFYLSSLVEADQHLLKMKEQTKQNKHCEHLFGSGSRKPHKQQTSNIYLKCQNLEDTPSRNESWIAK